MAGRVTYKSAKDLQKAVDAYFAKCDENHELYGEAGLALALHVHTDTLHNWWSGKTKTDDPAFREIAQDAYLRIQNQLETDPAYREKGMPTMAIFRLKQKYTGGYTDKSEQSNEVKVHVKFGDGVDKSDFE